MTKELKARTLTPLELMVHIRDVLKKRTGDYYPIIETVMLLDSMDEVYYVYQDGKLSVAFILHDEAPPKHGIYDAADTQQEYV